MPNIFFKIVTVGLVFFFHSVSVVADVGAIDVGAGHFIFEYKDGQTNQRITVWHYLPKGSAANAPVLFVMHGVRRDGKRYRNDWVTHAEREKALLLVPKFSTAGFPGSRNYSADPYHPLLNRSAAAMRQGPASARARTKLLSRRRPGR
jgi:hypothetical protein